MGDGIIKVLSVRQPWATLIANGYKNYEFRSWLTKYRGEIYIHASKSIEKEKFARFNPLKIDEFPTGKIIAKASLVDCIKVNKEFEDNLIRQNEIIYGATKNRTGYAFKLENVEIIEPISVNGKLGIWEYNV